jgi:hypothetical protein
MALNDLKNSTTRLGDVVRKFAKNVCPNYHTKELPTKRWQAKKAAAKAQAQNQSAPKAPSTGTSGRQNKKFNMNTYKFHALGDYVSSIRLFGTPDSYTSQLVSTWLSLICSTDKLKRVNLNIGVLSAFILFRTKESMPRVLGKVFNENALFISSNHGMYSALWSIFQSFAVANKLPKCSHLRHPPYTITYLLRLGRELI